MHELQDIKIAVIGLGYVGLPLAVEFGKKRAVVGFDISETRVADLCAGVDHTREVESEELACAIGLTFTTDASALVDCNFYIVTVPTPIDDQKQPDLTPLIKASEAVGRVLQEGDFVVYESTVYPGATEEDCVPILERVSGLRFNSQFFVGYSPERINPGDKQHRLPSIQKVTSGSTEDAAQLVDDLYASIITAGTFKAQSIRVAEAAKVIENTQRDLNIALVNELSIIFHRLGIDTTAVLETAATKWNFLPFRPGLVGGHCIGVDPYYLTHKAQSIGYYPEIILAGRRMNDGMGAYVAGRLVKEMLRRRMHVNGSRVLILGLAFKENCPDIRNTKVTDVISELQDFGVEVDVHDPWVAEGALNNHSGVSFFDRSLIGKYDAIILAVAHNVFIEMGAKRIRDFGRKGALLFDVKSALPHASSDLRL